MPEVFEIAAQRLPPTANLLLDLLNTIEEKILQLGSTSLPIDRILQELTILAVHIFHLPGQLYVLYL